MSDTLHLWPLRVAVFTRLTEHPAMAPYEGRRDGAPVTYPQWELGPVRVSDESTDSGFAGQYTAHIDFWGLVSDGGGKVVPEMMEAAMEAVGDEALVLDDGCEALFMRISVAEIRPDVDQNLNTELVHGTILFVFHI